MNKKQTLFSEEEIPYKDLSEFGLTHEMIEDLPEFVINDILDGYATPVLPIKVRDESLPGYITAKSRFRLEQTNTGVQPIFFPVLEHAPIEQFSEEQQAQLKTGNPILAEVTRDDDNVMSFIQIDPDTNQVVTVPSPVIGRNLQVLSDKFNLSSAELNVLQKGSPLTVLIDDTQKTVGIDLINSPHGIRQADGDIQEWKLRGKREWDKYTFGVYGCWITDGNGELSYVPEEDYTEEIKIELEKRTRGAQNAIKR